MLKGTLSQTGEEYKKFLSSLAKTKKKTTKLTKHNPSSNTPKTQAAFVQLAQA